MMKQISILGCGWLGLPLAKAMLENGFLVNGSTTSQEKITDLKDCGINPFMIALSENKIDGNLTLFLQNSTILIIDVPPKLRGSEKDNFVSKIKNVIPFIEESSVENVLFISSTSVYGENNSMVTEETERHPDTESGIQLLETETILQNNSKFKTTILRFGGLIGDDRHPVRFLAGRKNLDNPNGSINLIHQKDCIGIIMAIIQQKYWGNTFNAVTPFHPSRQEYYTQKAKERNLEVPEFNNKNTSVGKTISSSKIEMLLGYSFVKPKL